MSTKKQNKKINEKLERPLIKGANILIKKFKNPSILLEFITRSFYWIEVYCNDKEHSEKPVKKDTYPLELMIDKIVLPWLRNDTNVIKDIAEGIESVWSQSYYEGYIEYLSMLVQGFGIDMYEGPFRDGKMKGYLLSINTMYEIGYCIESYEDERKKISEAGEK